MREKSDNEIVGTLFDSDKTYYRPNLSAMKIGDFDLYTSTFFTFVSLLWEDPIVSINRIERRFRICIPRYKDDWMESDTIFNPNTGNFYSFEYFQIALSAAKFHLYDTYENGYIFASFSKMFKDEVFAISALFNDLRHTIRELTNQREKTLEHNGSYDTFQYFNELEALKTTHSFLCECRNSYDVPLENYTVFSNMTTPGLYYSKFDGGWS